MLVCVAWVGTTAMSRYVMEKWGEGEAEQFMHC